MGTEQEQQDEWDAVAAERSAESTGTPAARPVVEQVESPVQAVIAEPAKPTVEEQLIAALSRLEKIEGRQRNVEGHIGGLNHQQKLMNETFAAARTAAAEVRDAPTHTQVKQAIADPAQWSALKEDFPEWSDATEKFLDTKLSGLKTGADEATVNRLVQQGVADATTRITQQVESRIVDSSLNAVFPGWKNEVASEQFGLWLNAQAEDVKTLANSSDVGDAARMLSLFTESKKNNPTQQILNSRKQKLEAAVAAPRGSRPAPVKSPDQMTAEELWNYEARRRDRANA